MSIATSPIGVLADEYVARYCELFPSTATAVGVSGYDHLLDSYALDSSAEIALCEEFIAKLGEVLVTDDGEELAREVMLFDLSSGASLIKSGAQHLAWGVINSPVAEIYELISTTDSSTPSGVGNVRSRIVFIGEAFRQWRGCLTSLARSGVVNNRAQTLEVIAQLRKLAQDGVYFEMAATLGIEQELGAAAGAMHLRMAEFLESEYLPLTRKELGVGREAYQILADAYAGCHVDLDTAYSGALAEIKEISAEMRKVAAGIKPGASLEEAIEFLDSEAQYKIVGGAGLIDEVKRYVDGAIAALNGVEFDIRPEISRCDVQLDLVASDASPYYVDPSDNFSRAGCVWYPTMGRDDFCLWRELSTIYHEGVPGHHLQVASAMLQRESLTSYQRLLAWGSGYGEGWALYSERLMDELGYFADPAMRMGHLIDKALRVVRVIIDIGLHCGFTAPFVGGWEFDNILRYFLEVTQTRDEYARSELNRYISWPGQAISYKVGEQAWLAARASSLARGEQLRDFHNLALAQGPMPLELFKLRHGVGG